MTKPKNEGCILLIYGSMTSFMSGVAFGAATHSTPLEAVWYGLVVVFLFMTCLVYAASTRS